MQNLIDGVIRELEQKNYFEAIKYCNQLIAQFPKNYIFYEIRGNCYLETGSFVTAIQNYTDALELIPQNDSKSRITIASIYNRRGYARLKLNLYNESILDFQKAVEFKHDFAEAYNNCGNAYRKLEKYDDALIQCSRAIEYKEDFAEAYNNRGNIYYLFSKAAEAIKDYTKAIELNPNYTGAYYNRGVTYFYLLNKISEAKEDWEKVIALNPSYEGELKEKIDKIKSTLELSEGKPISEAMSLVSDEEQEDEIKEEPAEKEANDEKQEEPKMEIYSGTEEVKPEEPIEEVKPEEPVEEVKPEETVEEINQEEKKEEDTEEVKKTDDIEIPEIDFKSMFKDDEKEPDFEEEIKPLTEIFELIYEPKIEKDVIIPEEVRQLHNEISEISQGPKIEEPTIEEPEKEEITEQNETELPNEPKQRIKIGETPSTYKPYYFEEEEKRSVFKSPIFVIPLVFIILIILSAGAYYVYNRVYNKKILSNKQQVTEEKKDTVKASGNIDSTQIKDTSTAPPIKNEVKQEQKQTEKKEEKTTTPEVTTIKNFVVIKDKDGIYLQVASLKEKGSAETKAASLNKKGLTAKVVEADLGFKGIYYRVRVGPFKNTDEAKTAANKID